MTRVMRLWFVAALILLRGSPLDAEPVSAAQPAKSSAIVVYLPALPVESANRLAGAITDLGAYLSRAAGLTLEVKAFRRAEDVTSYLEQSGAEVALLVTDAALLHDLPRGVRVLPLYRFTRGGRETTRKVIVARDPAVRSLRDLRGKRLAVAYGPGAGTSGFIARAIFGGEIAPEKWFAGFVHESDDLSAVASVLFGRADAALVSESNPLVAKHLGKELREVFTSGPVSLPVIALREGALDESQQSAVRRAIADLATNAEGQKTFANMGLEGVRQVNEAESAALMRLPSLPQRTLEVVMPSLSGFALNLLTPLKPDQLPFVVGLPIVDAPLPTLLSETAAPQKSGSQ